MNRRWFVLVYVLSTMLLGWALLVPVAKADTLAVSAQFAFGNVESGAFSFDWDTAQNQIVAPSIQAAFEGTRPEFTLVSFGSLAKWHEDPAVYYPFLTWRNEIGDFLQLALFDWNGGDFPRIGDYALGAIQLWLPHDEETPTRGFLNVSAIQAPEPAGWAMLLAGLAAVGVLFRTQAWTRRSYQRRGIARP